MSASSANGRRAWPEVILSGRPFVGAGSLSKEANLDSLLRFAQPAHTAAVVAAAAQRGVSAIAPMNDLAVLQALARAQATHAVQVYPVIPNAVGYVREATDYGMLGAGIRLLRRLRLVDLLGIGLRGLTRVRGALGRDFRSILPILIDVEMAAFRAFRPPLVLLHGQVTDIAVALGNREALHIFADVVRRRFGATPGVVTNNFDAVMRALDEWGVDIPVVIAPFNSKGFLMKPNRQVCEAWLQRTDRYVIADRVAADGVESPAEAFAYLRGVGIRSAIVEITDADGLEAVLASRPAVGTPAAAGGHT
jgi:hypothetical protein